MFNMAWCPLNEFHYRMCFHFREEIQNQRNTSGIRKTPLTLAANNGRSPGLRIAFRSFINKPPRRRHAIRTFNFLKWIKAMHTYQAIM